MASSGGTGGGGGGGGGGGRDGGDLIGDTVSSPNSALQPPNSFRCLFYGRGDQGRDEGNGDGSGRGGGDGGPGCGDDGLGHGGGKKRKQSSIGQPPPGLYPDTDSDYAFTSSDDENYDLTDEKAAGLPVAFVEFIRKGLERTKVYHRKTRKLIRERLKRKYFRRYGITVLGFGSGQPTWPWRPISNMEANCCGTRRGCMGGQMEPG